MNSTRKNEMIRLRESGKTLQEIANEFGLSRERVRQIIGNDGRYVYAEKFEKEFKPSALMTTEQAVELWGGKFKTVIKRKMSEIHHIVSGGFGKQGEEVERIVSEKLLEFGIQNSLMPFGHPYDIQTKCGLRIEVKSAKNKSVTNKKQKSDMYHFGIKKRAKNSDYYICYIVPHKTFFVIPSKLLENKYDLYITYPTSSRGWAVWDKYENRFDLLKG